MTPLAIAVLHDHHQVVEKLLNHRAWIHGGPAGGVNNLYVACSKKNREIVELLIKHGADASESSYEYFEDYGRGWKSTTPLQEARGDIAIMEILLKNGANPNGDGCIEMLCEACESNDVKLVELFIEAGADLNIVDSHEQTPFIIACRYGREMIVKTLLSHGIDMGDGGATALYIACRENHRAIIKILLDHGVSGINVVRYGDDGDSPLHLVCMHGDIDSARDLIRHGADVNILGVDNNTPLHMACDKHGRSLVELLIKHGAEMNIIDDDGDTPLSIMCRRGIGDGVQLLIHHGANVNVSDVDEAPLHIACTHGWTEIVNKLIHHGANVNAVAGDGGTALHRACTNGWRDIAEVLIRHGADVYHKDEDGHTPRQCLDNDGDMHDLFNNVVQDK